MVIFYTGYDGDRFTGSVMHMINLHQIVPALFSGDNGMHAS